MLVADIMSRAVIAVGPDTPIAQAVQLMVDHKVSGIPVVDANGRLQGIVTEGDFMRRAETGTEGNAPGWFAWFFSAGRLADEYVRAHGRRVRDVMSDNVVSVDEKTPITEVVTLMQRHRIKRLPVMQDGKLVGIVSRADLVRAIGETLRAAPTSESDAEIRSAILEALKRAPWATRHALGIDVKNGVVTLDGCVFDIRERDAIGVLAENMPGVKAVQNRLACIEPTTGMVFYDPAR
jgi:CBS domain-containing protein